MCLPRVVPLSWSLHAVTLQESDIVDPSKRSMFNYVKMDVQNLRDMLHSDTMDEASLIQEINDVLNQWMGLFCSKGSLGVSGSLEFMRALEKLSGLLGARVWIFYDISCPGSCWRLANSNNQTKGCRYSASCAYSPEEVEQPRHRQEEAL